MAPVARRRAWHKSGLRAGWRWLSRSPDSGPTSRRRSTARPSESTSFSFQHFLGRSNGRARAALARSAGEGESSVDTDARSTVALEVYLPVPAHRASWSGGEDVLVATARDDGEAPVAYDTRGRRRLLDARTPPATPVLAVVPVEADFSSDSIGMMLPEDGGGGGGGGGGTPAPTPPAGLYMTSAHFVEDFEGWLKGGPEYEIHILGQSGASDSLTSYQCAGEHASGFYAFDQNSLDWTGNVLLFTQTHSPATRRPIQTKTCGFSPSRMTTGPARSDWTGIASRHLDRAAEQLPRSDRRHRRDQRTGQNLQAGQCTAADSRAAYSWITSQDDLIGNAIEDSVVGEYHSGASWIVRGESNVTNGWLKLQMR